jgi:N-methylhydantoinase B/oxoprolinase/acetone carboxylase alpha subunit
VIPASRLQLTVRKEGEHLYVDNAGTDPQTGSINVTYAGFSGAFLAALTASLTADLAGAYGGVYRRVHLEPVPGTLSCADFPAAVSPAGIYTMETLISLSGAVIGKMLACAEPEVARLAIGPAHPVFYGFISGGVHPTGEPFVATNTDNMIGSLAASPAGDGVDFGGHFWIPEGTASNIEELELLWPMLFLYRRALKAGADGAGRFRGGRGFVEAGIPWTVPGLAAAVYVDESFLKAVGPFGANPASAGHFRLKRWRLLGADDLEVLVDEDVVRPVDADVADLVLAVAQLHHAVHDAPRVGGQRSFRCLIRCRAADDRPRPLTVVRRDLTDLLGRGRCTALEGDHLCRRGSRRSAAASRLHDDLRGRNGR